MLNSSFNSRTLGRVRPEYTLPFTFLRKFQFTHPGKGATSSAEGLIPEEVFQFTHPGKGATVWCKVAYYRADKQA